ncbi:MAG: TFIIB-type zinc finger domain-containing protein [Oscillospiraceae bacterium]|nr:TFIIB-type zinc finger domain-containing protein [Oscillospiraceae bacterium]
MKQLKCEMCGGTDLVKQDGLFICQSCGVKYSVEEAKKMMVEIDGTVEVKGTVKVDHTDKVKNLYQLARMDIDKESCGNAQRYYEGILLEEPTSWEAQFFVEYIKCWNSKVKELYTAPMAFSDCLDGIINLIKNCENNVNQQRVALATICTRSEKMFDMLFSAAKNRYDTKASEEPFIPSYKPGLSDYYEAAVDKANNERAARAEFYKNCDAIFSILTKLGDAIETVFVGNEEFRQFSLKPWTKFADEYILLVEADGSESTKAQLASYVSKIRKYDSTYGSDNLPESTKIEIENALKNKNLVLAIKKYQEFSGKTAEEAKECIKKFALINGIEINPKRVQNSNLAGAEGKMRACGIMGLTPYTFICGIFALCFVGKAKEENGGSLSKKAKRYLLMGVIGFFVWFLAFAILFASIA